MENRFIDLIEETKNEIKDTKKIIDGTFTLEVTILYQKILEAQQKKLATLEDLFFEYTMENLQGAKTDIENLAARVDKDE